MIRRFQFLRASSPAEAQRLADSIRPNLTSVDPSLDPEGDRIDAELRRVLAAQFRHGLRVLEASRLAAGLPEIPARARIEMVSPILAEELVAHVGAAARDIHSEICPQCQAGLTAACAAERGALPKAGAGG